jgi:hypothetical protein
MCALSASLREVEGTEPFLTTKVRGAARPILRHNKADIKVNVYMQPNRGGREADARCDLLGANYTRSDSKFVKTL